jgi:DNA-binding FrmR family transcriptional regulator
MHGYTPDKDRYLARLRRIEGQVRAGAYYLAGSGDASNLVRPR